MIIFDLKKSFWSVNPQYKTIGEFSVLYESDKTAGRKYSSDIAWAAACFASRYSEYDNLVDSDKILSIDRDLFKEKGVYERRAAKISPLVLEIHRLEDTSALRQLRQWKRIMDEKTLYMESLTYEEDGSKLERLLASNGKLYDEYDRIHTMLIKEDSVSEKTKGNSRESLLENGTFDDI